MRLPRRRSDLPVDVVARAGVPKGNRVLAFAHARDGAWLLGTRAALHVVTPEGETVVLPWESVEDAAWDSEAERLRVTGVGEFGRPKPAYSFTMEQPALLLQLVRERVTASVVLQRRVAVRGKQGVTLIGRRSPVGGEIRWFHAYDTGLDPDDPEVVAAAERALRQGQAEVGEAVEQPGR